ncbi:MAG: D-alanyl-D-alanine carboxypeptidase family protein [Mariprofundales bacterium]|nr:D-alanyl-D-alanine carboxypeptidase family protein [Mariprofundales bacterium]
MRSIRGWGIMVKCRGVTGSLLATVIVMVVVMIPQVQAAVWPKAPSLNAKAWVLLDVRSGQLVTAHNADQELPPASLTKLMTLYLIFEDIKMGRLQLDERIAVSKKAWKIGGSTMFLDPRMHPRADELIHGIATYSGNDACIAMAEHLAGTESAFADRMNETAATLGMKHSHFVNATGFPVEGHYSSAHDMALLAAALWHDFPEQYKVFSEKSYTFNGRKQYNRNSLLWSMPGVDGLKTGHTKAAGYCLITSMQKEDTRFVSALFGAHSDRARASLSKSLLKYGFRNFISLRPAARDLRRKVDLFGGTESSVWLVPQKGVWVTVPKGYARNLAFDLSYSAPLKAPLRKGERVGEIRATIKGERGGEELLATIPMVTATAVAETGWIGRMVDRIKLMLMDGDR